MSAPKEVHPSALKAHIKALEECFARAKSELREAKKVLKEREEQLAFMTKAAEGNAEHAEAMGQVLRSFCAVADMVGREWVRDGHVNASTVKALSDLAKEWKTP